MKLKETKQLFQNELTGLYDVEEIDNFFYLIVEFYFGLKRISLALNPDFSISEEEQKKIEKALQDLKKEKPIQYILCETEFFGLVFKTNPHVLIPRPETEELVEWILNLAKSTTNSTINILDIGTGSGCIAVSVAKNLVNANVFALDVSEEALEVAKQNAKINKVSIEFIKADILNAESWSSEFKNMKFDIIVSNPPYVRELEKEKMKSNVLNYEPHLALFVQNDDPLLFYKAITEFAVNNLKLNGNLFFEINEYLGRQMIQLLRTNNFDAIELKQDIFKKDRMIKGTIVK